MLICVKHKSGFVRRSPVQDFLIGYSSNHLQNEIMFRSSHPPQKQLRLGVQHHLGRNTRT